MEKLIQAVKNKKVLILGFGREGKSTLRTILEEGVDCTVTVSDKMDVSKDIPKNVSLVCGENYLECLDDYDVVFKSPGIVLPKEMEEYKCEITSQTEIFISEFKNQIVGITGTKGKSTTSSFLYYALTEGGKDALFAGNIGIPVFDIAKRVNPDTIIVLELSCHQLEFAKTSPHRACLLNLYEDHLDHYGTIEKYHAAKRKIYEMQNENDILYTVKETDSVSKGKTEYIDKELLPFRNFDELEGTGFRGNHNLLNVAFAYKVCTDYGVSKESFIDSVKTFKTLDHRLEFVGCFNGIDYYDDSISTTVKSTISCVNSIKNSSVLLVGGMERNIDYTELVDYFVNCSLDMIVCMYQSGERIFNMYNALEKRENSPKALCVKDLEEAVLVAKTFCKKGGAVLLSPAAASYGYFKNFEERGDKFKELIKK